VHHPDELWQEFANNGESKNRGFAREYFDDPAKVCATSHVWLWRKTTGGGVEVLIQLRAADKRNWPSHWDISAAGHINLGETPTDAAVRETAEEIDIKLDPKKLYYIFMHRSFNGRCEEFANVFLYKLTGKNEFKFNDGEVAKLKWVSPDELSRMRDENRKEKLVPHPDYYFDQLFAHLKEITEGK